MKLVIATFNKHKVEEIRAIFDAAELVGVDSYPHIPPVVEDGDTFESNASKKAREVALAIKEWTLADDSGLEVFALDGEPGVYSARYAGEPVSYVANNARLLLKMQHVRDRRARFRCVIAISSPSGAVRTVEGSCHGVITTAPRGKAGFGYDPLFMPDGYTQTFAEMDSALKNRISHRANALALAKDLWAELSRT